MQRLISPLGSSFVHKVGTANASTTSLILGISYRREPELEEGLAGLIFNPYDSVTAIAQETEPGVTPCCHQPQIHTQRQPAGPGVPITGKPKPQLRPQCLSHQPTTCRYS